MAYRDTDPAAAPVTGLIAYLTGDYPKGSHTFILREVQALRDLGLTVLTCGVRAPDAAEFHGAAEIEARRTTYYIMADAKRPARLAGAHLAALRQAPKRWFAALGLAWRTRAPGLRALVYQMFYFAEAGVLAQHLRANGVGHLHNHFGDSSCTVAMLTSAISGIPFSFTEHGPALFFEPARWRIDEKIARARHVVAISHFCRSQLMLFSDPAHWGKIRIVHCGVDPAAYGQSLRETFGQHVLFVGRLAPVKGVALLLEAFAAVLPGHPQARLTVVGDGAERAGLQAQAARLGVAGAVTFAGYRDQTEVAALLETADMLVLPSFAEGVPVVLMEAMASRIPVIASRVAGVPELVAHGEAGFLTAPGDVADLAGRMAALLSDPALCRRMGAAGRETIEADFDIAQESAWLAAILTRSPPPEGVRP